MVGQVVDLKAFCDTARELRELGATYVRVGDCEARWEAAPTKAPPRETSRDRPLNQQEREELEQSRIILRREEEALSAS